MNKFSTRFLIMAVAYAVCLILSNILALRVWQFSSLRLTLSGADFIFPFLYILNNCITEVYGYRKMRFVLWLSFTLGIVAALAAAAMCLLPLPVDASGLALAESYNSLFTLVPRITAASLLAFLLGSNINAFIISKMKILCKGKMYWLRAVVSTVGGELVDTCIFIPAAYLGVLGSEWILNMILTLWVLKVLYEIVLLPLSNAFVRFLKKKEKIDVFDEGISYNPFKISDI